VPDVGKKGLIEMTIIGTKVAALSLGLVLCSPSVPSDLGSATPFLGTVYTQDAELTADQQAGYAAVNQMLYRRAYEGAGAGLVKDPLASELLSWRLLYGPALKPAPTGSALGQ
jgi:hypothetical protein